MATETVDAPLGEIAASGNAASGGVALSTTAKSYGFPIGARFLSLIPRNFSTAVVARVKTVPWLTVLVTTDAWATGAAKVTDVSNAAQDGSTSTTITLNSLTTASGEMWLGSHIPFRGCYVDVQNTNSTASTALAAKYYSTTGALVTLGPTDGTSSSVSLDQDGSITWTLPAIDTAWKMETLNNILLKLGKIKTPLTGKPYYDMPLYWAQFTWDQDLDSSVSLNSIVALDHRTDYAEIPVGFVLESKVSHGLGGVGGVEALTDAGTANLIINVASLSGSLS